jgi:SAM-dependent methyltransferase
MTSVKDLEQSLGGLSVNSRRAPLDRKHIATQQKIWEELVLTTPVSLGKKASSKERDEKQLSASTLVYGEIRFEPYGVTIEKIKKWYGGLQKPGGVFYDIGSGTGKPTFAAMLLHTFDKAYGVEILEGLHKISINLQERWEKAIRPSQPKGIQDTDVQFICGDAVAYDWSDADLCFANSTCFDSKLMQQLAKNSLRMKKGSFFITFTKELPSNAWKVLESERHNMSWGQATVYIQQKITDPIKESTIKSEEEDK